MKNITYIIASNDPIERLNVIVNLRFQMLTSKRNVHTKDTIQKARQLAKLILK